MTTLERHDLAHGDGRRVYVYGELRGTITDEDEQGEPSALHQRFDRLTGHWVAVSPSRNTRPRSDGGAPAGGERCPLCPGGPEVPFSYDAAVFENRFPSFVADPPDVVDDQRVAPSFGRCEVVLYTESHSGSLATLSSEALARVLAVWCDRSADLWTEPRHRYVLIFENRGEAVGATISHPHGQIYVFDHLPPMIAGRAAAAARYRQETGRCVGCEVVADDAASERVLSHHDRWVVAVPFAARWPLEVHVRARRHGVGRLTDLDPLELLDLAGALREVVLRYDGLFGFELPYMMVALEAPAGQLDWHLSFEFLPPHRNDHLMKIRASVETAAGLFINDTLPEASAAQLAAVRIAGRVEQAVPSVVARPNGPIRGKRSASNSGGETEP